MYRYESDQLSRYERLVYSEFDRLLLVSEQEKTCFPGGDPDNKIHAIPNARLIIVGGRPTAEVLAWQSVSGVEVTGFVEDIRHHILGADVGIAPLRISRGVQNKVLEAMAMGKAIVITPFALEGIRAKSDEAFHGHRGGRAVDRR